MDYRHHFEKIKFYENMAQQIIEYGEQCGAKGLRDYVDINSGAIPPGDYDQIIDPDSPQQFLSLYTQIAESQLAFAVTLLIKANQGFISPIEQFCFSMGKAMKIPECKSMEEAFNIMNTYVLNGMNDSESFNNLTYEENKVSWTIKADPHFAVWNKAGGSLQVCYQLQKAFINGLLYSSNIQFQIENQTNCSLVKQ